MPLVSPSGINDGTWKYVPEIGVKFDGDEMQLHVPQDYGTAIEVQTLMGVNKLIVSSQANRPIMGVIQDCLLGSYLLTYPHVEVPRHQFMDCVFSAGEPYVKKMASLYNRAQAHYPGNFFNGRVLFSILLPANFQYHKRNSVCKEEPEVIIENGILIAGIINKEIIGQSHGSVIHRLFKEYGSECAAEFLSAIQFLVNRWLTYSGFSVGVADFLISKENQHGVQTAIEKAYIEVQTIEESDDPEMVKEFRINSALNNRGQALAINGLCRDNRLEVMVKSGSKGNKMNIIQITGHLGQNNVEGRRIQADIDDGQRTLPCFGRGDKHPRCRGFIESSFLKGLSPAEFFMHAKAGREGVINTAVKTRDSGYTERKLVKRMEDLIVAVDQTVRNSVNNIIDFSYGDSLDPAMMYNSDGPSFIDINNVVERLNASIPAEPEGDEAAEILYTVQNEVRYAEIVQTIKEYRTAIRSLKTKGVAYKKMLNTARGKLKALLADKKELEESR